MATGQDCLKKSCWWYLKDVEEIGGNIKKKKVIKLCQETTVTLVNSGTYKIKVQ